MIFPLTWSTRLSSQCARSYAGDKFINQYQIIEKLGKGSFGKVKLIKHTETGETLAMKIFNKNVLKKKADGHAKHDPGRRA